VNNPKRKMPALGGAVRSHWAAVLSSFAPVQEGIRAIHEFQDGRVVVVIDIDAADTSTGPPGSKVASPLHHVDDAPHTTWQPLGSGAVAEEEVWHDLVHCHCRCQALKLGSEACNHQPHRSGADLHALRAVHAQVLINTNTFKLHTVTHGFT
jgi:hypothetical protein